MTPAGEEALTRGALDPCSVIPSAQIQTLRLLVRHGLASAGRGGRSMAVVEVTFARASAAAAECGSHFASRARALAAEILRGALREVDFAADNDDGLVVYMPETEPEVGLARVECTLRRVRSVVAADLGAEARILDPACLLDDARKSR